ncbi:uncharacterized protein IL334_000065 [Kwoniella shivajii]|uniref:Uncharacterized protein n=1 Tax=Kwoniella shivajii TaxID=564305 RepID=A0ABZ1CSB1_9TREE|nr:hypothetical protein IL334_000065 [Kwoniella shivajii]
MASSSRGLPHSGTTSTLNNWVDVDMSGSLRVVDVRDRHTEDMGPGREMAASTTIPERRYAGKGMLGTRLLNDNDKVSNQDDNIQRHLRKVSGGLKRKSIQLLRMMERKTSSHNNETSTPVIQRRNGYYHDDENIPPVHFDERSSSTDPSGSMHYTSPSKTKTKAFPLAAIHAQQNQCHLNRTPTPTSRHHYNSPDRHLTPIASSSHAQDQENTPEYPSFIGDSDSSGIRTSLKPRYSRVPYNTPEPNLNTSQVQVQRNRMTFQKLINQPLPIPNGEPSRYISSLSTNTFPNTIESIHEEEYDNNPFLISLPFQNRNNLRHSSSIISLVPTSTSIPDSDHSNEISLGINHMEIQDENEDYECEYTPMSDPSSALEALWEYGSSASSTDSSMNVQSDRQEGDGHDDDVYEGGSRLNWNRNSGCDTNLDMDMDISPDEYPFPPGLYDIPLSNLPSSHSLSRFTLDEASRHHRSHHHSETGGTSAIKPFPTSNSNQTSTPLSIPIPISDPTRNPSRDPKINIIPNSISSSNPSNFQLSSPLSDSLSLEDEEEDILARTSIAYRIPLKFETPEARRKRSLSVDSPFVELYKASDPDSIGE